MFVYLHCDGCETLVISGTWLAIKVRNLVVLLLMYLRTEVPSIQNTDSASFICSSFLHIVSIMLAMVAAVNSARGMVVGFKGATLAFPIMNPRCADSSITVLTCISKMMQLRRYCCSKVCRFKASVNLKVLQFMTFLNTTQPFLYNGVWYCIIPSNLFPTQILQDFLGSEDYRCQYS